MSGRSAADRGAADRPGGDAGGPLDPGLQPERTALAWRRTGLSVLVGALAGGRLLAPRLGVAAVVVCALAGVVGVALLAAAAARGRRAQAALRSDGDLHGGPGGALVAVTAAGCALLGAAGLALVVVSAARG